MPTLATCLGTSRLCLIHFVPYVRRLWLTLFKCLGFILNNNRVTPFRDGFLTAKGVPISKISLNDVFDFVYFIYILVHADVNMGTHYDDMGARMFIGLKTPHS